MPPQLQAIDWIVSTGEQIGEKLNNFQTLIFFIFLLFFNYSGQDQKRNSEELFSTVLLSKYSIS